MSASVDQEPTPAPGQDLAPGGFREEAIPLPVAVEVLGVAYFFFSLSPLRPPAMVPTSGPAEVFSAQRAWRHVEALAAEPRPVGSAGHQRAQRYLQERLRASGAEVHLLTGSSVNVRYGVPFEAGRVTNILARLRGTAPEEASAVLLVAHYDSMPGSPGAGDDAVGGAVLLETLRALMAGPALKGDVLLLFTDAEEGGLLGIQSFLQQHVRRERVGFVLNLDARGVRGPALLVSAAGPVGELVSGATRAAAPLTASSAFLWMARPWTRGTDFSPLAEAGLAGLNFVIVDGAARYHTGGDTPGAVSARAGTAAQPVFSDVAYGWDAEAGRGSWLSMSPRLDRYAHTLLGDAALRGPSDFVNAMDERVWQAPAPAEPLPAPRVQPEKDEVHSDGTRQVRLRLSSSREAPWLWVFLSPAVQVLEASVDGLPVADAASAPFPGERWGFRFVGLPPDGVVLELRVRVPGDGGDLTVVDQTFGLPASAPPRPGDVVPGRSWLSGSSLARTVWRLPGAVP